VPPAGLKLTLSAEDRRVTPNTAWALRPADKKFVLKLMKPEVNGMTPKLFHKPPPTQDYKTEKWPYPFTSTVDFKRQSSDRVPH
jgi:hypothetical protein